MRKALDEVGEEVAAISAFVTTAQDYVCPRLPLWAHSKGLTLC